MDLAIVRANEPKGISVEQQQNTITLNFPSTGILDIQGDLPTLGWHTPVAKYADGSSIPVVRPDHQISDDTIAFRPVGLRDRKEDWYVVGTYDDLKKAMEQKTNIKYPPDK